LVESEWQLFFSPRTFGKKVSSNPCNTYTFQKGLFNCWNSCGQMTFCPYTRNDRCTCVLNNNSFLHGLTDECSIMLKPELILEIDDDECEVIDEQGTDVDLDVTDNDDYEEIIVDESGDGESD